AGGAVVDELVADGLPRPAAVARALDLLAEPATALRRVDAIRISGRALQVVNLPAREERAADLPLPALAVGCQDERAFACTYQDPYSAHFSLLVTVGRL